MSAPGPAAAGVALPDGYVARLAPSVRRFDHGRTLIGGAPVRMTRVAASVADQVDQGIRVVDPRSRALAARLTESGVALPEPDALPDLPLTDATVVVPVRDRPDDLATTLAALAGAVRVVVVDDGSRDPDATRRVAAAHGAEVLALPANGGPAAARNAGLALVRTPYVVFVDSDVRVSPETLARLLRHFADPRVGLAAPRVRVERPRGLVAAYESAHSSLDRGGVSALVRPRSPVAWVPSAVLAARVAALGAGFDAGLRSGEDVDLVWRTVRDGWLVQYDAGGIARHRASPGASYLLGRSLFYGTSAAGLAARHGGTVAPAVLTPLSGAVALALLSGSPVAAAGLSVVAAATGVRLHGRLAACERPVSLAAGLVGRAVVDSARQTSGLLLRHWWPLAVAGAVGSRRVRRALVVAAVIDTVTVAAAEGSRGHRAGAALLRRADDAAYGAGVWLGALRARSIRCLLPRVESFTR